MRLSLKDLDKIPYLNEKGEKIDHMHIERPEQLLASLFVKPNMRVLELGGRYGTVSCVINNILDNPLTHLVVEPDHTVLKALGKNKLWHKSSFQIFHGVVSANPKSGIILKNYETSSIEAEKGEWIPVSSKTFKDIEKTFNLKLNCLFVDCEGAFPQFLKENLDTIAQFELIIFEADGPVNYIETHSLLKGMGFKEILNWANLHYVYINLAEIWPKGLEPLD